MNYPTSEEVLEWPEFKSFVERLGVKLRPSMTDLIITICRGSNVSIVQQTRGVTSRFAGKDMQRPQPLIEYGVWKDPDAPTAEEVQGDTIQPNAETPDNLLGQE